MLKILLKEYTEKENSFTHVNHLENYIQPLINKYRTDSSWDKNISEANLLLLLKNFTKIYKSYLGFGIYDIFIDSERMAKLKKMIRQEVYYEKKNDPIKRMKKKRKAKPTVTVARPTDRLFSRSVTTTTSIYSLEYLH